MSGKIRVLVIDGSPFMRQVLKNFLSADEAIEVVGVAADPYIAWEKVRLLQPDVLTLDMEMSNLDGIAFLEEMMRDCPLPVVTISSLTEASCAVTLRALNLGAIDFITRPKWDLGAQLPDMAREVIDKIKAAATASVRPPVEMFPRAPIVVSGKPASLGMISSRIVAVGASTGGTEAIREFLMALPADCPSVLVVQHMPEKFTRAFADRLDGLCRMRVKEAGNGDRCFVGQVLIAAGDYHMRLAREGPYYLVRLGQDRPVNRHRPSVDVLFSSCAAVMGSNAIGVLLTGMGKDGARGLLQMRTAGARTLAQDEATCVVFGMPRAAVALDAAEQVLPLNRLADTVMELARNPRKK